MINYEEIDNGIIDLIKLLNYKGFPTIYSCSGLLEDHDDFYDRWEYKKGVGYICFLPLTFEQEKKIKRFALSSHLEFYGREDKYSVPIGKMREHCVYCRDRKIEIKKIPLYDYRCTIRNVLPTIRKKGITIKYINNVFKRNWDLFKKKIELL
jgi:hypothetical protein